MSATRPSPAPTQTGITVRRRAEEAKDQAEHQGPQAALNPQPGPGGESSPCSNGSSNGSPNGCADARPDGPFRFEQRACPRYPARGRLAATYRDPEGQRILTRVELTDLSESGLGVHAPLPAKVGSTIELHDGPSVVYAGTVARCQNSLSGHLIGLRLAAPARAA